MESDLRSSGLKWRGQARRSLHQVWLIRASRNIIVVYTKFSSINHIPAWNSRFRPVIGKPIVRTKEIRNIRFR